MNVLDMYLKQIPVKHLIILYVNLWWAGKSNTVADLHCNDILRVKSHTFFPCWNSNICTVMTQ